MFRKIAADHLANLLSPVAHPARIRIIEELRAGELTVSELQRRLDLSQSAVSQHLSLLRQEKLVEERREGRNVFYHLTLPQLADWLVKGLDLIEERARDNKELFDALTAARKHWS
jgi:ArsR family transcriptional regulator